MRIVTTQQMRQLEEATVAAGATWPGLMEQAGWGVAQEILGRIEPGQNKSTLILVGPGNNGGDALVVARHLHDANLQVTLYIWRRNQDQSDLNWESCQSRAIPSIFLSQDTHYSELRRLLSQATLVVDGLLGMGTTRLVTGELAEIIASVNAIRAERKPVPQATQLPQPLIVSIDLPTGIIRYRAGLGERPAGRSYHHNGCRKTRTFLLSRNRICG